MQKAVSRDGTTIAYQREGEGPPFVLLGGGFRDHTAFTPLVPWLAPHFSVYTYDRRGRGESGDAPTYEIAREVEDLQAVIGEAGGDAIVFGGSSGGILALEAVIAGAGISRLTLLEPPYRLPGYRRPPADFAEVVNALIAADKRAEVVEYFLANMCHFEPEDVEAWRQSPVWPANLAMAHTLAYDTILLGLDFPAERLAGIDVETLLINSEVTSDWMRAATVATAEVLPHGRHVELPGFWHRVPPETLAPVLIDFCR